MKVILHGVSGHVPKGSMLAVLGSSGGGKTTLMNLLSGRTRSGYVSGSISVDRLPTSRTGSIMKNQSAYVLQEDMLIGTLTPRETLRYTAELKGLPASRVEYVMAQLDMHRYADTLVSKCSGGEKKRLSIAVELLDDSVRCLFLDEPLSGLDSFTAVHLLQLLRQIASDSSTTMVCTLHQPSFAMLELFDRLLVLSSGRAMYFGPVTRAVRFYEEAGFAVPEHTNPADWFVTVGRLPEDSKRLENAFLGSALHSEIASSVLPPSHVGGPQHSETGAPTSVVAEEMAAAEQRHKARTRPGLLRETWILTGRSFLMGAREPMIFRMRMMQAIVLSLLVGLIYFQLGYDQSAIQSRSGACFMFSMNVAFSGSMTVVMTFTREKPIYLHQHAAGIVRPLPYFFAKLVFGELLFQVLYPIIMMLIAYFMVGFQIAADHWFVFLGLLQLGSQAATGLGFLISTMATNPDMAMGIAPLMMMPLVLFGGLLLNVSDIPPWFAWLRYFSYILYMFNGLVKEEFSSLTFHCTSSQLVQGRCPVTTGEQAISNLNLEFSIWESAVWLAVLAVGLRLASFVALEFVSHSNRGGSNLHQVDISFLREADQQRDLEKPDHAPAV